MHKYYPQLTILAYLLLAISCSSLPTKNDETPQNTKAAQAKEYSKVGDDNKAQGNYTQAEKNYNLSLDTNFSIDNLEGISESYNSLGNLYLEIDDSTGAEQAFEAALKFAKKLGNQELEVKAHINTAKVQLYRKNYDKALEILAEAEKSMAKKDTELYAILVTNQGLAYLRQGQFKQAVSSLSVAYKIHESLKSIQELASVLYIMASANNQDGDTKTARENLIRALELDKSVENSDGIASDLLALYQIDLKLGAKTSAYDWLERSFRVSLGANDTKNVKKTLTLLVALSKELGLDQDNATWSRYLFSVEK